MTELQMRGVLCYPFAYLLQYLEIMHKTVSALTTTMVIKKKKKQPCMNQKTYFRGDSLLHNKIVTSAL